MIATTLIELLADGVVTLGVKIAETQIFEFLGPHTHPQSISNWRKNIKCLGSDPLAFICFERPQRTHIVDTVSELDQNNPNVLGHRQQHLAEIFCFGMFARFKLDLVDLADTVNQLRHILAKASREFTLRGGRVFDDIMQQRRHDAPTIQSYVG